MLCVLDIIIEKTSREAKKKRENLYPSFRGTLVGLSPGGMFGLSEGPTSGAVLFSLKIFLSPLLFLDWGHVCKRCGSLY